MDRAPTGPIVAVADVIPEPLRQVFGFESFNQVQSKCTAAFTSGSNLVLSAPTGSGKTDVLLMAICRELHKSGVGLGGGKLAGKAVYLAPLRALCEEKCSEWTPKLKQFGLTVCLLTGDDEAATGGWRNLAGADVLLSTPEKFDAVTRNHKGSIEQSLISTISLIMLDEVHHLGDSRGFALEAVVARMLLTSDELRRRSLASARAMPVANLRVLALSATIPNLRDLAAWLRVPDSAHCKSFSESYRPVPLEYKVLGYNARNQWTFNQYLSGRCFEVVAKYASSKPALVFCPSRKSCHASAQQFVDAAQRGGATTINRGNAITRVLSVAERAELCTLSASCTDKANSEYIRHGVACHTAEVSADDRELIERLFRRQLLRVLFCTTTLSCGVNLPARLVVIMGTTLYQNGGMAEIDKNQVMQMVGRAGRPQFDSKGVAVIMTAVHNTQMYERLCGGKHEAVNSTMEQKLPECMNAEVSRALITDVPTAVLWMKATFLYAQRQRSMQAARLEMSTTELVLRVLNDLVRFRLIQYDDTGFRLRPRNASTLMARYYISFATMKAFVTCSNGTTSEAGVLQVLSKAAEFTESLFVRRSERRQLNDISERLRFPLRRRVKTVEDKVYLLLQCGMSPGAADLLAQDFNLKTETRRLAQSARRVAKTLVSYLVDREERSSFTSCLAAVRVARGLENGTYWDGGSAIRQLKGVGPAAARRLLSAGVRSLADLAQMEPRSIERALKRNAPHGSELLQELHVIPRFHALVEPLGVHGDSLHFRVRVSAVSWTDGAKGGQGAEYNGFVLVGSHDQVVDFYQGFQLKSVRDTASFDVSAPASRKRTSRWIDFLVGPMLHCGVDFHHRIHVQGSDDVTRAALTSAPVAAEADDQHIVDVTGPELAPAHAAQAGEAGSGRARRDENIRNFAGHRSNGSTAGRAASRRASPSATRLSTGRLFTGAAPVANTQHNREDLRRRARPLTATLPLKRLRGRSSSSAAAAPFAGTPLAPSPPAAVAAPAAPVAAVPPAGGKEDDATVANQVACTDGEDSYCSIFSLLAAQMDADDSAGPTKGRAVLYATRDDRGGHDRVAGRGPVGTPPVTFQIGAQGAAGGPADGLTAPGEGEADHIAQAAGERAGVP